MEMIQKMWMFEHWMAEQKDKVELAKNSAYLLASFDHPEAVKQLVEGADHSSTDEEFEAATQMVRDTNLKLIKAEEDKKKPGRKRRRHIKE